MKKILDVYNVPGQHASATVYAHSLEHSTGMPVETA
jgi:hypothetical protein